MRAARLFLLLPLILLSSSLAKADGVTFEGLTDSTSVTNEFPNLLFLNATVLTAGVSLNDFEFPPRSGNNVVFDSGGPMSITFASPVTGVGGYFTYAAQLTITAYDASNNVIGTLTSAFNSNLAVSGDFGSQANEFLTFSMLSGITRITIAGDPLGGSFTLDDLTFTPSVETVPEPGGIVLFLTGSAMLFRFRRRFSKVRKVSVTREKT